MSSRIKRTFTAAALTLLAIAVFMTWWLFGPYQIRATSVFVEDGDPFHKVVRKLKDGDVVKSPWFFSKIGLLIGLDRHILAGRYDFDRKVSNFGIMRKLWRGDIVYATITVPEGYTLRQIGTLLDQQCGGKRDIFDSLVRDSQYLALLGVNTVSGEGYLFPETYRFPWGISVDKAIRMMVGQLFARVDSGMMARCDTLGYTLHDLLTMASIVEREGLHEDEFGLIASVYRNRYRIGMKLQADPTVIYGMGNLNRKLLTRDYQFPSEYNTYLHLGLPPTPICSPGMAAIEAALYPDSTNYLYFVADGSGRHVFNKTYQEHLSDIRQIRRNRK